HLVRVQRGSPGGPELGADALELLQPVLAVLIERRRSILLAFVRCFPEDGDIRSNMKRTFAAFIAVLSIGACSSGRPGNQGTGTGGGRAGGGGGTRTAERAETG